MDCSSEVIMSLEPIHKEKTKEKRAGYASAEQKKKLFALMQDRPALCSGRFSANFSKKDWQKEWLNLTAILNGIPGGKKTWTQWRKTWQDMRSKVKTKQATIKRYANGTGGGPPLATKLKPNEESILSLMSEVAVNGHSAVQESLVQFDFGNSEETARMTPEIDTPRVINMHEIDKDYHQYNVITYVSNASVEDTGTVILQELNGVDRENSLQIDDISTKKTKPTSTYTATPSTTSTSVKKHTVSSAKKLQVAAYAAEGLSETAKEKLEIKKAYYKRKLEIQEEAENRKRRYDNRMLEIMEKRLIIEERKACALEKISGPQQ